MKIKNLIQSPVGSSFTSHAILLFATSLTMLAYEIILMRLLSIALWHHFAYMVISMALLGFGASGSILFIIYERIKKNINAWLIFLSSMASVTIPLCFSFSQSVRLDPLQLIWQPVQWIYLLITYCVMSIPFIFGGAIIGAILVYRPESISRMYALDLIGAGCGALIVIPVLFAGPPWMLLPFLGCIILVGALLCCLKTTRPVTGLGVLLISGIVIVISYYLIPPVPRIHHTKALPMTLAFPDARIEAGRYGPLGLVDVAGSSQIRHVPGLSLKFGLAPDHTEARIPEQKGVFLDADGLSPITHFSGDLSGLSHLDYTSAALPYHVKNPDKVLVIGSGGGSDILLGLFHNTPRITALETNRQIADLVSGPFSEFSGDIYKKPQVRLEIKEARQYLHSTDEKYDLIQLSLTDSFVNSAGGLHSTLENYLHTTEAFREYLSHLTDSGILSITRWIKLPPRDLFRTLSTALASIRCLDIVYPEKHVILIRSWKTFTILVSLSPFTSNEILKTKEFCSQRSFDLVYYTGMSADEANQCDIQENPYYYNGAKTLCGSESESFEKEYLFNVSAVTDDKPYFSNFIKWKNSLTLFQYLNREWLPMVETGSIFILATLVQASFAGVLLILAPLIIFRFLRRHERVGMNFRFAQTIRPLFYFGAIGLGFMFFEMVFISQFTLLLSSPVYAATVVLATVLVFTGLGSISVGLIRKISIRFLWIPVAAITCWVLIHITVGGRVFAWAMEFSLLARLIITVSLLIIPAFFLGWMFPSGLRVLSERQPHLVPWAWGINGCASVIGAVLGKILAINMGFRFVMIMACLLYLSAIAVFYIFVHPLIISRDLDV